MNSLKQIRDQLLAVWNRSSKATRAAYVGVAAGCLLLIVGVGIWSSRPQLVPLATNLSPTQAAQIIDLLDAEKITNKMNFSGSTVLVPKKDYSRARLVVKDIAGLPDPTLDETPSFPGFIPDPDRSTKRLEQQIAQTLMRMRAIKHASVTLALPDPTPFVREKKPATAAVVVELHPNMQVSRQSIGTSVASTVSYSVSGLTPDNVTVFDTNGQRLFSGSEDGGGIYDQLDHQRRVEADITAKAQRLLAQSLGEGASALSITADIDFTQRSSKKTTHDPDGSAKQSEDTEQSTVNGDRHLAQGAAGVESNLRGQSGTDRGSYGSEKTEKYNTKYAVGTMEESLKEYGGKIARLSVAATVDLSKVKRDSGQPYSKDEIEGHVKNAVGFKDSRGDTISILVGKIVSATPLVDELDNGIPWWQKYERLVRSLSLGVAALVAFVVGLLIIRKLRPITVVGSGGDSDRRRSDLVDELASKARENPEAVSRILATWLNDPGRSGGESGIDSEDESDRSFEQPRRRAA
jgi:flagellar M-ring protein FliF